MKITVYLFFAEHDSPQSAAPGILGGIIKGLTASRTDQNMNSTGNHEKYCANLESLFSNPPFLKPSTDVTDGQEPVMLNLGSLSLVLIILPSTSLLFMIAFNCFGADDIVIDGPITVLPKVQNNKDEKKGILCIPYYIFQVDSVLSALDVSCLLSRQGIREEKVI